MLLLRGEPGPRQPVELSASPRLYLGFLDDQAFRWEPERIANFDRARREGATVVRSIVDWSVAARQRPQHPRDPFAPEYRLGDLDELVRNAERRGIEVLLTIWGTPRWANGRARPNVAPTDPRDLRDFAHALAARYSGRHPGFPFVRFYTVWNEPNAAQFLSPQFDPDGRSVAPRVYAGLVSAAYAGIKSASPRALVGAGETAARGRDRPRARMQDTHSPVRFARLVAAAAPRLRFDAWAHHPYARDDLTQPDAPQPWPAVGFTGLGRFDAALRRWFERESVPLWVTEFGYRTSPQVAGGAPYGLQALFLGRALELAGADANVRMLVWFVFRDEPRQPWQSGLVDHHGRPKPALAKFGTSAPSAFRSLVVATDAAQRIQSFRVPALELRSHLRAGERVVVRYRLAACGRVVDRGVWSSAMGADGWVPVLARLPLAAGASYALTLRLEDLHGAQLDREVALHTAGRAPLGSCGAP